MQPQPPVGLTFRRSSSSILIKGGGMISQIKISRLFFLFFFGYVDEKRIGVGEGGERERSI